MKNMLKALVAVSTALACLSGSLALADGIQSKDKARTPFAAGALTTVGAHSSPQRAVYLSKDIRNRFAISSLLRTNVRAQGRTIVTVKQNGTEKETVLFRNTKVFVNPGMVVDRLRLVTRGMGSLPVECEVLHTHERAICQRDAQLRRTERVKFAFNK